MSTTQTPETNLVPRAPVTAIAHQEYTYTQEQIELVKRTVAPGLSNDEFSMFMYVAKIRNLDPLQRQIHAVKRRVWNSSKNDYEERVTIQTGIDGYRAIANRTMLYMPSEKEPRIDDPGTPNMRITVWVKKWSPNDRAWHEFSATAWYREFVQTYTKNKETKVNSMWEKMAVNQLTKCAEALVIRKGWPEEAGGIYTDEEMASIDNHEPPPPAAVTQAVTGRAAGREVGTLTPSTSPHRPHGEEGMTREKCAECNAIGGHLPACSKRAKSSTNSEQSGTTSTTPSSSQPSSRPTSKGLVYVSSVDGKKKNPTKAEIDKAFKDKKEAPKPKEWRVLTVRDGEGNDFEVSVWDHKLWDYLPGMCGKDCVIEVSKKVVGDKTYWNLEGIHQVGGENFIDNKPVIEGEVATGEMPAREPGDDDPLFPD